MALDAGYNYQGRDGELRLIDKSQSTAGANGTPWGVRVSFEQMDLNMNLRPRPPQNPRLDREKFNSLAHRQLGADDNLFNPITVTFGFHMSSRETTALLEMAGVVYMNKIGTNTADATNGWRVKGTPSAGLVSTINRAKSGDGLYAGGILDGKGSLVTLPAMADPKVVGVDMETIWAKRDTSEASGFRFKESVFDPGKQRIVESADYVTVSMSADVYGNVEPITAFSQAMSVLTSQVMPTTLSSLDS